MDQVKCGKGIESLYNIIEGTYSRKCLINNQTLDINIVKNQDSEDSVQWKIIKTEKKMKKFTGHGIKSLFLKLNEMFTEMTFPIVPEVLCLVRATKKEVRYVICAMDDADLANGRINFEVLDVNVTPYELSRCLETRLALYDGSNIYPITDQAKAMVGLYTDAVASFKSVATVPIGAAMLLNEKISEHRKLDVIYEDSKTRIKPLMSVCSEQFVQTDQVKFIKDFLEEIPRQQLFYCESDCYWTISNGVTNLYVPLTGMNVVQYSFEPVIRITVSETPGVKKAVTLLAKVGEGYVYLCSNKEERVRISKKRKSAQESYQSVYFDGFVEEMDSFDKVLDNEITLSDDVKNKLALCIGKKRYASVMPKVVSMTLRELIKTSYVELPSNSQVTKLMKFYKELA